LSDDLVIGQTCKCKR